MFDEALKIAVILPAAGQGRRFESAGGARHKLDCPLDGKAVLIRSIELFAGRPEVAQIIVAPDPDKLDEFKMRWGDKLGFLGVQIVPGGKTERWETVANALQVVDEKITHVAVHDAARPAASVEMIDRVFEAAAKLPAVVPAVRVSATVKRSDADALPLDDAEDPADAILGTAGKKSIEAYRVSETVPRDNLWLIQTPQVIAVDLMRRAHALITEGKIDTSTITDDAGLVEALGEDVALVPGDPLNVKITVPDDLAFAEAAIRARSGKPAGDDPLGPKRKFPTWAQSEED